MISNNNNKKRCHLVINEKIGELYDREKRIKEMNYTHTQAHTRTHSTQQLYVEK